MRMALCWPSLLLLCIITLFASSTCADTPFTLSDELKIFIPPCAQACFLNFVENYFPASTCSTNPTLDCLCSTSSVGEYTVGEGAVECIIAETNVGFCQGAAATNAVATNAYFMCNGQANALPNTDSIVTATFIIQSTDSSIVFLAPFATHTSATPSTTASSGTPNTGTPSTISPTFAPSSTSSFSSSRTSSTSNPTSLAPTANEGGTTTALPRNKIVAISVSAAGGLILLIALIAIITCTQRRRQRARDSDMIPFQSEPEFRTPLEFPKRRGSISKGIPHINPTYGFRTPMEIRRAISAHGKGGWAHNPPPVPPRLETSDPHIFSRSSITPDTIGLAISPERNPTMEVVRSSRLLPEKPTLWLNTGNAVELAAGSVGHRSQVYPRVVRESVATQFEEDDDSIISPPNRSYSQQLGEWQGLAPAPLQTMRPAPSTTADSQNAIHSDENYYTPYEFMVTGPDYYVRPLSISRPLAAGAQLQPPAPVSLQNPSESRLTNVSSVYSQASAVPYPAPNTQPQSQNPPPPRQQSGGPGQAQQGRSRASECSLTSFDSISPVDTLYFRNTLTTGLELSPVVEHGESPTGVSPVSYPRIKRLSSQIQRQKSFRAVPPPAQPNFMSVFSSGARRDELNENGKLNGNGNGVTGKANSVTSEGARSEPLNTREAAARAADMNLRLSRSQALALPPRTNLPHTPPQTPPRQAKAQNKPQLASPFKPLQAQVPAHLLPNLYPLSHLLPSPRPSPTRPAPSQRSQAQTEAQANPNHSQSVSHLQPSSRPPPAHLPPGQQQQQRQQVQQTPPTSVFSSHNKRTNSASSMFSSSTSSSLLTKRLGDKKAAQLLITTTPPPSDKWRVLTKEDQQRARQTGWKPMLSGGLRSGGGGPLASIVGPKSLEDMELPQTPGWVHKLTPTRRGNDLFLSVA